jgi:acyl-CoA hydrolase
MTVIMISSVNPVYICPVITLIAVSLKTRTPSFSKIIKTEVVCPNDTNPVGILLGGRLVQWMDIAAAVCAQTHAGKICVTASIDSVSFENPAHIGDVVTMEAKITRAFNTSMEISVKAWTSNVKHTKKVRISQSYFTFVAIDEYNKPSAVIQVKPVSALERLEFAKAQVRRKEKQKP